MMRADFVRKLAMRMLAGEGIMGIWELQVAAANAHRRGQSAVAVMLTEIVDAAEQEWRLAAHPARCGSPQRRSPGRTDSRRSGLSVATGQNAPFRPLDRATRIDAGRSMQPFRSGAQGPDLQLSSCFKPPSTRIVDQPVSSQH